MAPRKMHLVGYLIAGPTWHNNGSWRHPESDADMALDPRRYERIAEILEEGRFDALFFVDVLTLFDTYQGGFGGQVSGPGQMWYSIRCCCSRRWRARRSTSVWLAHCRPRSIIRFTLRAALPRWITSAAGARHGMS